MQRTPSDPASGDDDAMAGQRDRPSGAEIPHLIRWCNSPPWEIPNLTAAWINTECRDTSRPSAPRPTPSHGTRPASRRASTGRGRGSRSASNTSLPNRAADGVVVGHPSPIMSSRSVPIPTAPLTRATSNRCAPRAGTGAAPACSKDRSEPLIGDNPGGRVESAYACTLSDGQRRTFEDPFHGLAVAPSHKTGHVLMVGMPSPELGRMHS